MAETPEENRDLLVVYQKPHNGTEVINLQANGHDVMRNEENNKVDGGIRAYSVVVGSFLTNGLLFGVINSFSVIYRVLQKQIEEQGIENSRSRASLVGALAMGTTFFLSPLSGALTGLLGIRTTAVLGGSIAALGLLISSFVIDSVNSLSFTYGIMYGLGASLAYTPSLAILGHYFKKYLGLANGVVTIGSSIFTVIMPPLMEFMILNYGLDWMFRVLAGCTFGVALCGLLFKPVPLTIKRSSDEDDFKSMMKTVIAVDIWKNNKYKLWALSMPVALFGYFVPYVHIGKFIELNFKDVSVNLPLQCIAITSGIGRLTFGFLADRPGTNQVLLQQISFYVIGTLTILLPFVPQFYLLVVISLGMGLFDGAFIALIGPIAIKLCGGEYAAQAIGCMLGMAAFPLSIGPPVAGYLFELYDSYTLPFVLAGVSPLIGASLMFFIKFNKQTHIKNLS